MFKPKSIIRVVKMEFNADFAHEFADFFSTIQPKIAAVNGCSSVKLLQDTENPCVFFTLSIWQHPADLEAYRNSVLFKETWSKVKIHFTAKAEAWSLNDM